MSAALGPQQRLALLAEASRALATAPDAVEALDGIARALVPGLAAACSFRLEGRDEPPPPGGAGLVIPLEGRNGALGALVLEPPDARGFGPEDVATAEELARRVAAALDDERLLAQARRSLAQLDMLFSSAPFGIAFFDDELRFVRVNAALAEITGLPPEAHVGRTMPELLPDIDPRLGDDLRRALERGEALVDVAIEGATPAAPGKLRSWLASCYPVRDAEGRTLGLGAVVTETTGRRRAEQRAAVQHAVAHVLAEAASLAEARPRLLAAVAGSLDFDGAEYWAVAASGDALEHVDGWYAPGVDAEAFDAAGAAMRLRRGEGVAGRTWASGETEWLGRMAESPYGRRDAAHAAGIVSVVGFPLLVGGEVRAVVTLFSRRYREPDDDLRATLLVVGSQVGQFAERRRAEEELAQLLEREQRARAEAEATAGTLRKLERVTEVALAHLPLDALLEALLARLRELLAADTISILLLDEAAQELVVTASVGLEEEARDRVRIPFGRGIGGRVAASGEPLNVPDTREVDVVTDVMRERVRSIVAVPLVVEGRLVGVAHAGSGQLAHFGSDDLRLLQLAGDRMALAIVQSRLYEAERAARDRVRFLAEASAALVAPLDADAAVARVAELAVPWIADSCRVELVEPPARLRTVATAGERPPGPAPGTVGATELDGARRLLRAPLVARGRVVGALSLARGDRPFAGEEVAVVEDLARRAAAAVETARLYRAAEERAQAARVLASIGDGVFLVDAAGVVRLWNPAAEAITGLAPADVVGRRATEVLPGWAELASLVPVSPAPGPPEGGPQTLPLGLGRGELWVSMAGVEIPDGVVYAFRDLTAERRLEAMRGEFVATVSHELRTPLAAVYGAAVTLRRSAAVLDESQREALLDVVADESERLARIVVDVLWAARLDSGALRVTIEGCDASSLAGEVVRAAGTHLPAGIDLRLDAAPDVPPAAADADKVRQVLVNLVDNAIKYSPDGGRVTLTVAEAQGRVRFAVADEGLGIPASEQRRIFEKFYRLDPNLTRGVGGTGLGLYICRELVARMDGTLRVESRAGAGSTFSFDLPVSRREGSA